MAKLGLIWNWVWQRELCFKKSESPSTILKFRPYHAPDDTTNKVRRPLHQTFPGTTLHPIQPHFLSHFPGLMVVDVAVAIAMGRFYSRPLWEDPISSPLHVEHYNGGILGPRVMEIVVMLAWLNNDIRCPGNYMSQDTLNKKVQEIL